MPLDETLQQEKYAVLRRVFGYDSFRPGQEEVADQLLAGGDVLAVMPTGAGKSICYQLPALLLPGVAVVVSPLISLMQDQVQALVQMGVRAAYINSSLSEAQCRKALANAAAARVKADVRQLLELREPLEVATGFDRPNLYFEVQRLEERQKYGALRLYLSSQRGRPGIVYCSTRKKADEVYARLREDGWAAARYHAGLEAGERQRSQDDFLYDRVQVMVATNAFGMGIDKPNVGFVVHYNMPLDLESYYQEAGRAGRDGQPADCILLYAPGDVRTANFLIDQGDAPDGAGEAETAALREAQRGRLRQMTFYCHSRYCLRGELLRYFGQRRGPGGCGNCSVCRPEAQKALPAPPPSARRAAAHSALEDPSLDAGSVRRLKALRLALAKRAGLPAFVIFTDATLRELAVRRPATQAELMRVPGLGMRKCELYGAAILQALQQE